jgi:Flp pilus assembly pilin Flp
LTINAALIRGVSVQVRDLSTGGCLLETRAYLPIGTVGVLDLEIEGKRCVEWFRIRRTQATHGRGGAYLFGAEFLLPVAVAESSLRGAVRRVYRIDRVSGRTGRMSGEPGNSMVFGTSVEWSMDTLPADSARQVLEFRRPDTFTGVGSQVAQSEAADGPRHLTSEGELPMKNVITRFVRNEEGQDLIEYVLIGSFVSIGALAGATLLGTELNGWYDRVAAWVSDQGPGSGGE